MANQLYQIVTAQSPKLLEDKVNLLMGMGWITQGGVSYSSKDKIYMQSMIVLNSSYSQEEAQTKHIFEGVPENWVADPAPIYSMDEELRKIVKSVLSPEAFDVLRYERIATIQELVRFANYPEFLERVGNDVAKEVRDLIRRHGWV